MSDFEEEKIIMLRYALDDMMEKIDFDISCFSTNIHDRVWNYYFEDNDGTQTDEQSGVVRIYKFNYNTREDMITFSFIPFLSQIKILFEDFTEEDFYLQYGQNQYVKKQFMDIWRTINQWEKAEIPRQKRENFMTKMMQTFSSIETKILTGGMDEKENPTDEDSQC